MTSNVRNYNELQVFLKNCHDKKTMEIEIIDKIRLTNIELNLFLCDFIFKNLSIIWQLKTNSAIIKC